MWVKLSLLLEKARLRRTAYKSGRREKLGIGTTRDEIGFEIKGRRKVVPKRKRPVSKPGNRLLDRTPDRKSVV